MHNNSHSRSPDTTFHPWPVDIPSARPHRRQRSGELPGGSLSPQPQSSSSSSLERSLPSSAPSTPHVLHYAHAKEAASTQASAGNPRLSAFGHGFRLHSASSASSDQASQQLPRQYGPLSRHKRTCSASSSVRPSMASGDGAVSSIRSAATTSTSRTMTPILRATGGGGAAAHANLGRRSSIAITNLSIVQGLSIDPDLLDMDEDESMDGDSDEQSIVRSASLLSDGDDGDVDDDGKVGNSGSQNQRRKRQRRPSLDGSTMPRNKAVVRLMSLVEGDKQALASEMEHESQITRSIRHSCVQEWLRASPAHDHPSTPATAARDSIPFPASPVYSSSSVVSSPRLAAAPSSTIASPVAAVRPSKRKSVDDGYPYKRQAMSPLGLRAQIAIGRRGGPAMLPHSSSSSSSRSSPSSPQMMARPVALPVSHLSPSTGPSVATAGTCPASVLLHSTSAATTTTITPALAGAGLSPGFLGSRGRSRSGTSMAVLGTSNMSSFSRLNISDPMDDEP
ncbi:hypothetical protein GGI20_002801 [Coemansia sp. BCRC 34301]|nr:hypothetical protein GGI20_002801 [Coemansia sp. BCRC 34301]